MARLDRAHEMLATLGLTKVDLTNKIKSGTTTTVRWRQWPRLRMENYQECVYEAPNGLQVTVFVAGAVCKNNLPPDSFNTSGYRGMLHMGIVKLQSNANGFGIFLVIHPRDWKPYQHRFKPNHLAAVIHRLAAGTGADAIVGTIVGVGTGAAGSFIAVVSAGTLAGASFGSAIPIAGTIVGAAVGAVAGLFVAAASLEDHLHFLG